MIQIENLVKNFKKHKVLDNINLTLENGTYGILGPNGAGKTTLLRCLTGLYEDYKGSITIDNHSVKTNKTKKYIGYLPQNFSVFPEMNIYEMMDFYAHLKKISSCDIKSEIDRCLDFTDMKNHLKKKGSQLSGGMIRRIGIAQALLGNPSVIIMDEPTVGLDPEEQLRFKNMISKLDKEKTILLSTHIVSDVEVLCDKIIVMKEGKILSFSTVAEITSIAEGKVYEIQNYDENWGDNKIYIEREYIKDGKKTARILVSDEYPAQKLPAGLEDGYLCLMKNLH